MHRATAAALLTAARRALLSPLLVTASVALALAVAGLTLPLLAESVKRPDERGLGMQSAALGGGSRKDAALLQQSAECLRSPQEGAGSQRGPLQAAWAPFFSREEALLGEVQHFELGARVPSRGAPPTEAVLVIVPSTSRVSGCLVGALVASLVRSRSFPRSKDVVVVSLPPPVSSTAVAAAAAGGATQQVLARKVSVAVAVEEGEDKGGGGGGDDRKHSAPYVRLGVHAGAVVGGVPNLDLVLAASTLYRAKAVASEKLSYVESLRSIWMQAWEQTSFLWARQETLYGALRGLGLDSIGFRIHNATSAIAAAEEGDLRAVEFLVGHVVPALENVVKSACSIQESLHHSQTQYSILAYSPLQVLPLGAMLIIPAIMGTGIAVLAIGKLVLLSHEAVGHFLLASLQILLSSIGMVLAACSTEEVARTDSPLDFILGPIAGGIHLVLFAVQPPDSSIVPLGLKTAVTQIYTCGLIFILMFLNAGASMVASPLLALIANILGSLGDFLTKCRAYNPPKRPCILSRLVMAISVVLAMKGLFWGNRLLSPLRVAEPAVEIGALFFVPQIVIAMS